MTRKKKRLIALGALVLALAIVGGVVIYSLGGGDGYEACMRALRTALFDMDNYTLKGTMALTFNGQKLFDSTIDHRYTPEAASERIRESAIWDSYAPSESVTYIFGGTRYSNIDDEAKTYQSYSADINPLFGAEDNELNRRAFDLFELLADFMAGDAKNNVIRLGKTDGETEYQLRLSESQMPESVKLIMSIYELAQAEEYNNDWYNVEYENKRATFRTWHTKDTGEVLPDNFFELVSANKELRDAYYEREDIMDSQYHSMLKQLPSPCILYVAEDGATTPYSSLLDYASAQDPRYAVFEVPEGVSIAGLDKNGLYPEKVKLKSVEANARIDEQDRPTACDIIAAVVVTDAFGAEHEIILELDLTISDFGTTVPESIDLEGYSRETFTTSAQQERQKVTVEVVFDGITYTVTYAPVIDANAQDDGGII